MREARVIDLSFVVSGAQSTLSPALRMPQVFTLIRNTSEHLVRSKLYHTRLDTVNYSESKRIQAQASPLAAVERHRQRDDIEAVC